MVEQQLRIDALHFGSDSRILCAAPPLRLGGWFNDPITRGGCEDDLYGTAYAWKVRAAAGTATVILAGTSVALTSTTAAAATSASSSSGVWPGVGKICEPGPGGASTVRGVGSKTINIAEFNDASNTIDPGLEAEFPQQATAFADWCNAAGGIDGRKIVIDNRDAALFNAAQQADRGLPERLHGGRWRYGHRPAVRPDP